MQSDNTMQLNVRLSVMVDYYSLNNEWKDACVFVSLRMDMIVR